MLLKTFFLLHYLFSNIKSKLIYFIQLVCNRKQLPDILNLQIEMGLEFKNTMNLEIIVY